MPGVSEPRTDAKESGAGGESELRRAKGSTSLICVHKGFCACVIEERRDGLLTAPASMAGFRRLSKGCLPLSGKESLLPRRKDAGAWPDQKGRWIY